MTDSFDKFQSVTSLSRKMPSTTEPSTFSISLPQMLDLTFGKNDNQSVNFKMLHSFLHLLLHCNGLNEKVLNYQGEAADEMRAFVSSSCKLDPRDLDASNIHHLTCENPRMNENMKIQRQAGGGDIAEEVANMRKRMSEIENEINVLNEHVGNLTSQADEPKQGVQQKESAQEKESALSKQKSATIVSSASTLKNEHEILGDVDCCKLRSDIRTIVATLTEVRGDVCDLRGKIYEISRSQDCQEKQDECKPSPNCKQLTITSDTPGGENYLVVKQKQDSYKPTKCTDLIMNVETSLKNMIQCIEDRSQDFEDYVNCSLRNINCIISQNKSEEELIRCVQSVREELKIVRKDVETLQCNEVQQNLRFDALTEEICLLRTTKADLEAMEEALAEKASICALAQKVSCEQFDAVYEELTQNLNELMVKLSDYKALCQETLLTTRCILEEKIDNLEIPALKDYINYQLQLIKDKLKQLSQMKQPQESAGGKTNLRCIVCDKDVYMKANSKITAGSDPFPCRMSTRPYTIFKMNQQAQEKTLYQDKNLLHLEKIVNCSPEQREKERLALEISDRYCGGSHTVVTAEQKILKSKDDYAGWPIHHLKLEEGFIKGTDGQMYRGRWIPEKCADKP